MDTTAMARLLDELRGGNWGLEPERRTARAVTAAWPKAGGMLRRFDRFRSTVAEDAVLSGMAGVIFAAAGYPLGEAPHLAAARASPAARYFYPGPDGAIAGQRALSLAGDGRAAAFKASLRDPDGMLRAAGLLGAGGEWLGGGPWQLQWGLAAMLMPWGEAADLAGAYRRLLPPGSELVIAVPDGDEGRRFAVLAGAFPHSAQDVAEWCAEAGLEPGWPAADVRTWGREAMGGALSGRGGRIVAAVARVP